MTLTIAIQTPGGVVRWVVGSTSQAAAIAVAQELAGPDAQIIGWRQGAGEEWHD